MKTTKIVSACALALAIATLTLPVAAQKKGPKKKQLSERERISQRITKVRDRLAEVAVNDSSAQSLEASAKDYLASAEKKLNVNDTIVAQGLVSTADALTRAVDHIRHSQDAGKKEFPPREEQSRHLERAYFRLQQADYFQTQSKDARAKPLAKMARRFYQRARQAFDHNDARLTDEFTKVSEEIVKALETLAHTATPAPVPPRLK
jgi:biopolymer transport protein ExbB/TolQ